MVEVVHTSDSGAQAFMSKEVRPEPIPPRPLSFLGCYHARAFFLRVQFVVPEWRSGVVYAVRMVTHSYFLCRCGTAQIVAIARVGCTTRRHPLMARAHPAAAKCSTTKVPSMRGTRSIHLTPHNI